MATSGGHRGLGKQSLLYSQALERQSHCTLREVTGEEGQESGLNQAGGEPRERAKTHGQAPLWKVRVEYARKGMREFPWCMRMLLGHGQGQAEKKTLWCDPPYHTGALSHWGGVLTA